MKNMHTLLLNEDKIEHTAHMRPVLHSARPYAKNPLILANEFCDREKLAELEHGKPRLGGQQEGPFLDQHKLPDTSQAKGIDRWFVPAQFGARVIYPNSVVRSPLTGRIQMYYTVNGGLDFEDSGWSGGSSVVCYAESDDGINWDMPVLNKVKVFGSTENNVIWPPGNYPYIVVDDQEKDPQRRYKAFIHPGPRISWSPDGLTWSAPRKAVLKTEIGRSDGDTFMGWDDLHGKYVAYFRPWKRTSDEPDDIHFSRKIGRGVSDDLIHWSDHKCILWADEKDPPWTELERMLVFRYADVYLGLIVVFLTVPEQRHAVSHMIGSVYTELAYSTDGINWRRFDQRQPFLSYRPGVKDFGLVIPGHACVPIDDELYFYYEATSTLHGEFPCNARCNLARLTKDRFVGLRADDIEGTITTKPFVCPGGRLRVNADVRDGELRASVIAADGYHEVDHAVYRCNYIEGDSIEHTVRWKQTDNLDHLKGRTIALKFYARNAEVFSYWFET